MLCSNNHKTIKFNNVAKENRPKYSVQVHLVHVYTILRMGSTKEMKNLKNKSKRYIQKKQETYKQPEVKFKKVGAKCMPQLRNRSGNKQSDTLSVIP